MMSLRQFNLKPITQAVLISAVVSTLAACGGSGSDSNPNNAGNEPDSTSFSLAVSDAPVDQANEVVVYFDTVELIGEDGNQTFDVRDGNGDPMAIDLLQYQGDAFVEIVSATDIPLGTYSQLRLVVTDDSYISTDIGTFDLAVPSGELKLDGFVALPNVEAAYTVEFDLRKSVVDPVGQTTTYFLKPRGVRLVANSDVGTLSGTVSSDLITHPDCSVKAGSDVGNAVYIYGDVNLDAGVLGDDADNPSDTQEVSPYAIATVNYDEASDSYSYVAGYLPAGDYTVAFSCLADVDEPESDENAEDGFTFQAVTETSITAGNETVLAL